MHDSFVVLWEWVIEGLECVNLKCVIFPFSCFSVRHSISRKLKGVDCLRKQRHSFLITDKKDDVMLYFMHPRTLLGFLAARACRWLISNLTSTQTPRSLSMGLLSSLLYIQTGGREAGEQPLLKSQTIPFHKQYRKCSRVLAESILYTRFIHKLYLFLYPHCWCFKEQIRYAYLFLPLELTEVR